MQFKFSQWVIEIGFGIGILLVFGTALMLAMQHHSEIILQPHQSLESRWLSGAV